MKIKRSAIRRRRGWTVLVDTNLVSVLRQKYVRITTDGGQITFEVQGSDHDGTDSVFELGLEYSEVIELLSKSLNSKCLDSAIKTLCKSYLCFIGDILTEQDNQARDAKQPS